MKDYLDKMKPKLLLFLSILLLTTNCNVQKTEKTTTIYLIRHAEKENDGTRNPHLSKKGLERVEKLKTFFADKKLDIVYSTDYWRTKETAMPIAQNNDLTVELYNPSSLNIDSLVEKHKNILIVGHSNTTPYIANQILKKNKYQKINEDVYDNLFIIKIDDHRITTDKVIKVN